MEILSSGSFINLENQEKIEQLKFTAAELANAATISEGFVNEEEPAKKLALEFWQGLEYMCRENEQATIQNIFLNHFLERLRKVRAPLSTVNIVSANESQIETATAVESQTNSEDEFLGVIKTTETGEQEIEVAQNLIEETSIQTEDFSAAENDLADDEKGETAETDLPETEVSDEVVNNELAASDSETDVQAKPIESSFGLPEKEPYQFNKCTVTATIQLLPAQENSNVRKAVLSVRTHEFAPQISMVELVSGNLPEALAPELEKVLAKYQADLPLKVIDKMKKEKTAAKRNKPKPPTSETKKVSQAAAKPNEISSGPEEEEEEATPSSEPAQTNSSVIPQTEQTVGGGGGLQGSLFG